MSAASSNSSSWLNRLGCLALILGMSACATNPATGKRQLALIGEEQEIQMGREAAASIRQTIGLVDDKALQAYVAQIGQRQAAASERNNMT